MKSIAILFLLSSWYPLFAQDTFQLAPPVLNYSAAFFLNKTTVKIKFAQSATAVHYTLNNQAPTIKDAVYTKPVVIKNNFTTLQAKAFGNNFYPSATAVVTFIKTGKAIQNVQQTNPNPKYPGLGINTLIDNKGGIAQLGSNTWMGYNCDTVTIQLHLAKQETINKVLLNFLQDEGSWVFLPDEIIVHWFDKSTNNFKQLGKEKLVADTASPGSHCNYRIIQTKDKIKTNTILINIIVKKNIPSWHPAKGEHAWMFIDEIKVY